MNRTELAALLAGVTVSTGAAGPTDHKTTIDRLKANITPAVLTDYRNQYSPGGHDTMDVAKRPDKQVKRPDPNDSEKTVNATVKVNRIALALQKIITKRAVSFLFGNPVKINSEPASENEKKVVAALNRILYDNKINSFNRRIARDLFRSTEIAECWFPVERTDAHDDYGFSTRFKIRVLSFSPWEGNELYPHFDETGDLIAFSRSYERTEDDNKKVVYFETYTDAEKLRWEKREGSGLADWQLLERSVNPIGKIPVIYGKQDEVEWADVQNAIERLEYMLSNFADTNDYHAAPKIFVEGKILGFSQKGESGGILEGDKGSKASYLSWDHATDAVKLEIETLLRFIYTFTQTPDISFESVEGLNEISGQALKMLFMDAHLKVQEKREVFDEYLQRRTNVIKAYIGMINTGLKAEAAKLEIEADIQPFVIDDVKAMIDNLLAANAGQPIISQKTAIAQSGLVDNVDEEYDQIQLETERRQVVSISEPTL